MANDNRSVLYCELPDSLYERLRIQCVKDRRSIRDVVEELVREYLKSKKK